MKKIVFMVVCALCILAIAEEVVYERDGRGRLTGKVVRVEEGAVLPVAGAIEVSSSILPTGAATEDTLLEIKEKFDNVLDVKQATGATFNVVATELPLPTGAATESTLSGINARFDTAIEVKQTTGTAFLITPSIDTTFSVEPATTATFKTSIENDNTNADTVIVERITITGYSETSKTYSAIKTIKVFLQSAGKKIRLAFGGNDTSNNYLVIDEAKALGWTSPDINFDSFNLKLKGDTDDDTAVVVIEVWGKE